MEAVALRTIFAAVDWFAAIAAVWLAGSVVLAVSAGGRIYVVYEREGVLRGVLLQ